MFGVRDHIAVAGRERVSGYRCLQGPGERHLVPRASVSSYKTYDRFAQEHGFRDQSLSPCAVTVVDPGCRTITRIW